MDVSQPCVTASKAIQGCICFVEGNQANNQFEGLSRLCILDGRLAGTPELTSDCRSKHDSDHAVG